ncbi:ser thr protein phosphatase family protein [Stylonychia lemnae]|uniref:Ser thr protein phosphatase family protein n=1 Tax=Stylonychia lemnae TaxID=5949 RepID=A0A077ZSZ9_STYLE|nr:ser thr protein phosphatase family protein [Stylonychia lemnae]|eukprot:CDW73013.1 ser thr protein phosphatase family protein [Stylonychia lemnae]
MHKQAKILQLIQFQLQLQDPLNLVSENQYLSSQKQIVEATSTFGCSTCQFFIKFVTFLVDNDFQRIFNKNLFNLLCSSFTQFQGSTCKGLVEYFSDVSFDNLFAGALAPDNVCQQLLNSCPKTLYTSKTEGVTKFKNSILADKPASLVNDTFLDDLYTSVNGQTRTTIKILHLTDLHLDLEYTVGAVNECQRVICCRKAYGMAESDSRKAGLFGDYQCNSPKNLIQNMADYINNVIKPDVILWTGDNTPHTEEDGQSYTEKKMYLDWLTDFLKRNFTSIPVYPILGNHDMTTSFVEYFDKPDVIYSYLSNSWNQWLDSNALQEYSQKGYYKQNLKLKNGTIASNVYIIALNTQAAYVYNPVLFRRINDPGKQLDWLNKTLHNLETNNQVAIIIGHIAPMDQDFSYSWGIRLKVLTDRFQHIIRFSAFGHLHDEVTNIARSFDKNKPVGVQYLTGSLTPYKYRLPSFRVFEIDDKLMIPLQVKTHSFDIKGTNPVWKLDHELKQYFQMNDLSPSSFENLAQRISTDETLAKKYQWNKSVKGPGRYIAVCDEACRLKISCEIKHSVFYDILGCQNKPISSSFFGKLDFLYNPWYDK